MQRRLATILVADIAGYSRLMEAAEESTAARLEGEQPYAQRALARSSEAKADIRVARGGGATAVMHS